jgi:hypothetical protein
MWRRAPALLLVPRKPPPPGRHVRTVVWMPGAALIAGLSMAQLLLQMRKLLTRNHAMKIRELNVLRHVEGSLEINLRNVIATALALYVIPTRQNQREAPVIAT